MNGLSERQRGNLKEIFFILYSYSLIFHHRKVSISLPISFTPNLFHCQSVDKAQPSQIFLILEEIVEIRIKNLMLERTDS